MVALPKTAASSDLPYWVALSRCLRLGPARFALLRKFPSMAEAWAASQSGLEATGLEPSVAAALLEHRAATDVDKSWQEIATLGLTVLTIADPRYPRPLAETADPPPLLYVRGDADLLSAPSVAVVGTRRATSYGLRAAHEVTSALVRAGLVVVSGLAYGIDACAHRACLEAGGKTVAVMAAGLDEVYPTANRSLAERIVAGGGAWVSEFPPKVPPLKQHFPFRNRIIAGLTQGTVVIEAAPESGALLTAKLALEANREVFAVPGSIYAPESRGTNELIAAGAHAVLEAADVLKEFGLEERSAAPREPLTEPEAALFSLIPEAGVTADELVRQTGQGVGTVVALLTVLELKGYVRNQGGQGYTPQGSGY